MTTDQPEEWAERLTRHVLKQVTRRRTELGMSFEDLADECTKLGYPILRTTLANLENGRRKSVTVHELMVLARALNTSPVMLIYPVGNVETVETLPGVEVPPIRGADWWRGDHPLRNLVDHEKFGKIWVDPTDTYGWQVAVQPLRDWLRLYELYNDWVEALAGVSAAEMRLTRDEPNSAELLGARRSRLVDVERQIRERRAEMARRGVTTPPLPDDFPPEPESMP